MRIGVNLIPLRPKEMGGLEFYVRSLLARLLAEESSHQFYLFTAPWNHESLDFPEGRYRKILAVPATEDAGTAAAGDMGDPGARKGFLPKNFIRRWRPKPPLDLHDWVRRLKLDLWFCPMTNLGPRQLAIPTVITIPDIQQEYYPEFFTQAEIRARALMYKPSCEEASAVIAISHFSQQCIVEKYNVPHEKVHCVYLAGIEHGVDAADDHAWQVLQEKYQLPARYAFYPANMWPHKNHAMLILALHRLRQMYGVLFPLVLTGDDLGQWPALQVLVSHFRLQEQVRYLGYVRAAELSSLYEKATMLIFPSLFEGFGLPLLEAMRLGCPVAASNLTSIPEVVGEAGLLFDARAPDSIAEAMHRLLSEDTLRQSLMDRGRERAALFSWRRAARETLQVFEWAGSRHAALQQKSRPTQSRLEGVYLDGWAARRVRLTLPYFEEVEAIRLEGVSDYITYPLTIRMKLNGRRVNVLVVQRPGPFTMLGAPRWSPRMPSHMTIELAANRDFIPERLVLSTDPRSLAYLIERLSLICRGGEEVPLYTRSSPPRHHVGS